MKRVAIAILISSLTGTPAIAQTAPSPAPQPAPLQPVPSQPSLAPSPPAAPVTNPVTNPVTTADTTPVATPVVTPIPTTQPQAIPSPTTQPPLIEFPPPSTHPFLSSTTRASQQSAEDMLRQMLQPANQGAKPLVPVPNAAPPVDMTSGQGAVIPTATTQPLQIEGALLNDRVGRLTKTPDGKSLELTFDSDAYGNTDPPLILLQNHRLATLEDLVNNSYADLKIRVSGEITEYRGRNYLLITRWSQVADVSQPLK